MNKRSTSGTCRTSSRHKTTVPVKDVLRPSDTVTWFQVCRFVEERFPSSTMVTRQRIEQLRNGYYHTGTGRRYGPGMVEGVDFVYLRGLVRYSRRGVDRILIRIKPPPTNRLSAEDWSALKALPETKQRAAFNGKAAAPEDLGIVATPEEYFAAAQFPDLSEIRRRAKARRDATRGDNPKPKKKTTTKKKATKKTKNRATTTNKNKDLNQ